jgi:hypothetical protein
MKMSARTLLLSAVALAALAPAAAQAAWTRSYVAEWFEPAFYFGAAEGEVVPGTDCPAGSNPDNNWFELLKTSYRTDAEIKVILDPENSQKNKVGGIRGPNREDVYKQPWSVPDPGMTEVTGTVSYGLDLDEDATTGFLSPDGKTRGVDNAYYRTAGCWMAWRSPAKQSHHAKYVNDGMRDGVMSIVLVVSGAGNDPRNDNDVTVGFYMSKDKMVKDANGAIARDFSFRVDTDQRFQSLIKARTVDGVIESTEHADLKMRDIETAGFFPAQLALLHAKLRIEPSQDGKMMAMVGGYRPINDYWSGWAGAGVIHESTTHINLPGYWYALHRNADYKPAGTTGANTAISTAYQMYLTPAFVIAPDAKTAVTVAQLYPPAAGAAVAVEAPKPTAMLTPAEQVRATTGR